MSERAAVTFLEFDSRPEASRSLADALGRTLNGAVRRNGSASLVVSGGSSPVAMFRALRDAPLPWERITVVPSDEREVGPDHPDRNEAMIRRELLAGRAAEATLVSLIPPGLLPERFDAVVLGMGSDGHTASLFPGSPDLAVALHSQQALERVAVPQLGVHRISLTPSALLTGEQVCLLFFGDDKRTVFEEALGGRDAQQYPVRAVLDQARVPVSVYWAP